MKIRPLALTAWLALTVAFMQTFAFAQTTRPTVAERSYREARRVVDAAVEAYGGLEALRGVQNFTLRYEGHHVQRNQSRRPEPPYDRTPLAGTIVVDLKGNRFWHENANSFPGGFDNRSRFLVTGTEGVRLNLLDKRSTVATNVPAGALRARLRWLPHTLVLGALDRSSRLHSLGTADFEGRPHHVVTYPNEDALQLTLYLDAKTHLVSKFEFLTTDAYAGDAVVETIFPAHRAVGRVQVPTARAVRLAGELVEEERYTDVQFNQTLADADFKAPEGFTANNPAATNPPLTKVGEDAYVFYGNSGYNVLFVAFNDHVLVVEAPGDERASREVLNKIKEVMPNKPVRYVAVTHHHADHAGGARTYMAEGATLVTTPGNRRYFEQMARGRFTLDPDALAQKPRAPVMEFVERRGKRVFTDGTHTVELYDIGPGPHAEEMLVAYLPKEKVMFQGDLLNLPLGYLRAGNATTAHFADWLKKSGLVVEKFVPVHGPIHTAADFQQSLTLMQR
ncbi:MAG TPA: MBL fold metallo-hydrolase [Pyrinomonadaceae bacterium]|nr:MBL fold metallo-hydrolase [Pyrinomonadaceae bacterium]